MADPEEDVTSKDYWVEVSQGGTRLGAGFLLTRCYVLTALHCLQGIAAGNDEVDISFASGETLSGRVHRRSPEADLALIDVPKSSNGLTIPSADRANVGEAWRNPYRPSASHAFLSGDVAAVPVKYQCEGGDAIEAVQLGCSQPLGDYAGYSGSPIERSSSADSQALLGVLLEQYPEQYPDNQITKRASTVLFAATIAEVFRRFDCFDVSHLLMLLASPSSEAPKDSQDNSRTAQQGISNVGKISGDRVRLKGELIKSRIGTADSILEALHEWQKRGLLDESHVSVLKLRVARELISEGMGDDT